MRIRGVKSFKKWARLSSGWVKSRFVNTALILAYHRVAEVESDPYSLCVTPQHFAEQLKVLRRYAYPMSLQQLIDALSNGNLPQRAVAVTFDDGYSDNLYNGKPLLERYQTPATVFVSTGFMGREFWWDELNRALPRDGMLYKPLYLSAKGHSYRRGFSGAVQWFPSAVGPNARRHLLKSLYQFLSTVREDTRRLLMEQLWSWAGTGAKGLCPHLALTPAEVNRLAEGQLVEIGAHTVTHPWLATLSEFEQRTEIRKSKAQLEEILGEPVLSFSYPNGSTSKAIAAIVREAGFASACGSKTDLAWHGSDRFQLPRLWIPNWNGPTFLKWLKKWWSCE